MFRNYLKTAYRNLLKNKVSSTINIVGLSIAIACAVTAYLFIEARYTMDRFHAGGERIFLVENVIDRDGSRQIWGDSPRALGPAMKADFPQLERVVRFEYGGGTMQYEDKVFREGMMFVDDGFLDMFTFPLKYGDKSALRGGDAVILSARVAERYFGQENPVGRQFTFRFGEGHMEAFTVGGVAEEFPETAGFRFNILVDFEKLVDARGVRLDDWEQYTDGTFIQLRDAADLGAIAAGMGRYLTIQNAASKEWPIAEFRFGNLYGLSLRSRDLRDNPSGGPPPMATITIGLIGVFMLALACFNYMNISIATASRRLKEIGVRKVIGSNKAQLVVQFLSENVLLCVLSLVLGVLGAKFLLAPGFNALFAEMGMPRLSVALTENLRLWGFLVALLAGIGLVSGAYPAFYISSFKPVAIFRGRQEIAGKSLFTRAFLTFQFVLAFITMITGVALKQNADYQAARDWGYEQENTLVLPLDEAGQYAMLRDVAAQQPGVRAVAGSATHVGRNRGYAVVDIRDEQMESVRFDVGDGYFETMGLRLKAGRFFDPAHGSDAASGIVVNELFARNAGWGDAVGQQVRLDSTAYTVVGVVEDFHYASFFEQIQPVMFTLNQNEAAYRFLTMRLAPGAGSPTAAAMEKAWKRLLPDKAYFGYFQDTVFDRFYRESNNISKVFTFTALMSLLISCMGLFGLASQNLARRMKEISIRKVMGATVLSVTTLVNRGFLGLLALAAVAASPLAYFMIGAFLDGIFEYRMPLGPLPFVLAYGLVFATALITISTQVYKVVVANPAEVLRNE